MRPPPATGSLNPVIFWNLASIDTNRHDQRRADSVKMTKHGLALSGANRRIKSNHKLAVGIAAYGGIDSGEFVNAQSQRLLDIHMFLRVKACHNGAGMRIVPGCHHDGVRILRQKLAKIRGAKTKTKLVGHTLGRTSARRDKTAKFNRTDLTEGWQKAGCCVVSCPQKRDADGAV